MPSNTVKAVVVGDGAVGKNEFPKAYVPTVFDNYAVTLPVGGRDIVLTLFDTAGQEDYDRLRPLGYANASVFLLCFAISSRVSFENVRDKWAAELARYAAGVPVVLVGTQSDTTRTVSEGEGQRMARTIGAVKYLECSAKTRQGTKEVFAEAVIIGLDPKKAAARKGERKKLKCLVQ